MICIGKLFKNIRKITNVTKLRNFQFRLLHNIIFCNNILFFWNIKTSQICDNCDQKEDVVHMLIRCQAVTPLWRWLAQLFRKLQIDVDLTDYNIIVNKIQTPWDAIGNFIILATKFYIYRCKVQGCVPSVRLLVYELENWHNIEYYNAAQSNRMGKHIRKWNPVNTNM